MPYFQKAGQSLTDGQRRAFCNDTHHLLSFDCNSDRSEGFVRCLVPPSMKTQLLYTAYVHFSVDVETTTVEKILSAQCECKASIEGDCQHVAATLFTMQDIVKASGRVPGEESFLKLISSTSKENNWIRPKGQVAVDVAVPIESYFLLGKKGLVRELPEAEGEQEGWEKQGAECGEREESGERENQNEWSEGIKEGEETGERVGSGGGHTRGFGEGGNRGNKRGNGLGKRKSSVKQRKSEKKRKSIGAERGTTRTGVALVKDAKPDPEQIEKVRLLLEEEHAHIRAGRKKCETTLPTAEQIAGELQKTEAVLSALEAADTASRAELQAKRAAIQSHKARKQGNTVQ